VADGVHHDVASVVGSLSPFARWYLALSAMLGLSVWCFGTRAGIGDWPLPFAIAAWAWIIATVTAPPYIAVNNGVSALLAVWHARKSPPTPTRPAAGA
jgi:hypothetical protein